MAASVTPLRDRARMLAKVIERNAALDLRTTVLFLDKRVVVLRATDPLVKELQDRHGAVVVKTYPVDKVPGGPSRQLPPSVEEVYADVDRVWDEVDKLKQVVEQHTQRVRRSPSGRRIGSSHHRAKYSEPVVKAIRHAHHELKAGKKALAAITGIPPSTVRDMLWCSTWAHVA